MSSTFKKLLSLTLAVIMLLSVAIPAFAAEDEPMWQQWGYDSKEEFMEWNGLETDAEYEQYISEYMAEWEAMEAEEERWLQWRADYLAANPSYKQQCLNRAGEVFEWYGCASKSEFYDWYGFESEAEYQDYIVAWFLYDTFEEEELALAVQREKIALGGPAEGLGVMWMDKYVQFPDAQPELTNDRTMIPIRAFMELVGAKVDYEDATQRVILTLENGDELSFIIGNAKVTLKSGEAETSMQMDVAPYEKGGRTYVPVRFFSEILGYDVLWDDAYYTAVIIDDDAIISEIDKQFTIVNKTASAEAMNPEKTYKTTADIGIDITMFDTVNGNKTGKATGNFSILSKGTDFDMTGSLDMSSLLKALMDDPAELADAGLDAISKIDMDIISNAESGLMHMKIPALYEFIGVADKNAWIAIPTEEIYAALSELDLSATTMGDALYGMAAASDLGVHTIGEARILASQYASVFGDDRFVKSGSVSTLTIDMKKLDELMYDLVGFETYGLDDFRFVMRVNNDGSYSGSFTMTTENDGYTPQIKMTADYSASAKSAKVTMDIHIQNTAKLAVRVNSSMDTTNEQLRTAPPAGAAVLSPYDLSDYTTVFSLSLPALMSVI